MTTAHLAWLTFASIIETETRLRGVVTDIDTAYPALVEHVRRYPKSVC
jgi:hypothetical protein